MSWIVKAYGRRVAMTLWFGKSHASTYSGRKASSEIGESGRARMSERSLLGSGDSIILIFEALKRGMRLRVEDKPLTKTKNVSRGEISASALMRWRVYVPTPVRRSSVR